MDQTAKDAHKAYLIARYCRRFILEQSGWAQPTGEQFNFPQSSDGVITLKSLQDTKFECVNVHGDGGLCQQNSQYQSSITYTVKWKETGAMLTDSGY